MCSARDMSHQRAQDGSEIDRDGKNNQQARTKIRKTKKGRKRGKGWGGSKYQRQRNIKGELSGVRYVCVFVCIQGKHRFAAEL